MDKALQHDTDFRSRKKQRTQEQPEGATENPYEIEAPPAVRPHSFPAGEILRSAERCGLHRSVS